MLSSEQLNVIWKIILGLIAIAILIMFLLAGSLSWLPIDASRMKPETLFATLAAFVAVAMAIERAGQFFIQLRLKDEIDDNAREFRSANRALKNLEDRMENRRELERANLVTNFDFSAAEIALADLKKTKSGAEKDEADTEKKQV